MCIIDFITERVDDKDILFLKKKWHIKMLILI